MGGGTLSHEELSAEWGGDVWGNCMRGEKRSETDRGRVCACLGDCWECRRDVYVGGGGVPGAQG